MKDETDYQMINSLLNTGELGAMFFPLWRFAPWTLDQLEKYAGTKLKGENIVIRRFESGTKENPWSEEGIAAFSKTYKPMREPR